MFLLKSMTNVTLGMANLRTPRKVNLKSMTEHEIDKLN